jgi:murein DD-endopeptidase MepM/ murein hydrolase activator NlpD
MTRVVRLVAAFSLVWPTLAAAADRYLADGEVMAAKGMYRDYIVRPGDRLDAIAADLQTTRDELARANHIKAPYIVEPGRHIKVPIAKAYRAVSGDTMTLIAKRFGVSAAELADLNDLPEHGAIAAGTMIALPANFSDHGPIREPAPVAVAAKAPERPKPTPKPAVESKQADEAYRPYVPSQAALQEGEARRRAQAAQTHYAQSGGSTSPYGSSAPSASYGSYGGAPSTTRPAPASGTYGQTTSGYRPATPTYPGAAPNYTPSAPPGPAYAPPVQSSTPYPPRSGASGAGAYPPPSQTAAGAAPYHPAPSGSPYGSATAPYTPPRAPVGSQPYHPYTPSTPYAPSYRPGEAAPSEAAPAVIAAGQGRFLWPVRGQSLSRFGEMANGRRNDGLDIAAPQGTVVRAAAGGDVVYAGDQVPGFGNLVLVKHPDGWVTAYAHLDRIDVQMRQQIRQGESLGTVGTSGGVYPAQLHFEVRYAPTPADKAKPLDPVLVLPR